MTVAEYNLIAVSIAATLFSVATVASLIAGILLYRRIDRILDQVEHIAKVGASTSETVKSFIEATTADLGKIAHSLLTVQGIRTTITAVLNTIKSLKERKE